MKKLFSILLIFLLLIGVLSACDTSKENLDTFEYTTTVENQNGLGAIAIVDIFIDDNYAYEIVAFDSVEMADNQIGISFEGKDILKLTSSDLESFIIKNGEIREFSIEIKGNSDVLDSLIGTNIPIVITTDMY